MTPLDYAAAGLVAGLLALERKAFLQAMLARPLVAGALVGVTLGQPQTGLLVGAALELYFLGAVSLGAHMPDNELFGVSAAAACACALARALGEPASPSAMAMATLLMLPAAKLGLWADKLGLEVNAWAAGRAIGGGGEDAAAKKRLRKNLVGMWMPFATTALLATLSAALGALVLAPVHAGMPASLRHGLTLCWPGFVVVSAAVAVRSIRSTRALVFGSSAFGVFAAVTAALLWGQR